MTNYPTLNFSKMKFLYIPLVFNVILLVVGFVYLFFRFSELPPLVPIWYTYSWGEGQLGTTSALWLIPLALTGVTIINLLLILFVYSKRNLFLTTFLAWQNVLITLLGVTALWRIVIRAL